MTMPPYFSFSKESLEADKQDRIRARAENLISRGVCKSTAWEWARAEIEQETK